MRTISDALTLFDERHSDWGTPTGLREVDRTLGGMVPGRVWITAAEPGHGRTTWMLHLAATWARLNPDHVFLACPREPLGRITGLLLSHLSRSSVSRLWAGADSEAIASARRTLESSRLVIEGDERRVRVDNIEELLRFHPAALLIDDAHQVANISPAAVRRWTSAGAFVCISLPLAHLVGSGSDPADLDLAWAEVADVAMSLRTAWSLPPSGVEHGTALISILKNRWGPVSDHVVGYAPYRASFYDQRLGDLGDESFEPGSRRNDP